MDLPAPNPMLACNWECNECGLSGTHANDCSSSPVSMYVRGEYPLIREVPGPDWRALVRHAADAGS